MEIFNWKKMEIQKKFSEKKFKILIFKKEKNKKKYWQKDEKW